MELDNEEIVFVKISLKIHASPTFGYDLREILYTLSTIYKKGMIH